MMKSLKRLTLTFLIFLLILAACSKENFVVIDNGSKKIKIVVEIADTQEKRALGLMYRPYLGEFDGMLFVFNEENYHNFWMKNTLIPLDIIFISENLEIVDIIYAEPCKDQCRTYIPKKPAKYVLELNGNFTVGNNIDLGTIIVFGKKY